MKALTKRASTKKMKPAGIESVGWGFWIICFIVLLGPATYLGWSFAYDDRKVGIFPWVVGFGIAAFGAGLLSTGVNFAIQKKLELKRKQGRKKK